MFIGPMRQARGALEQQERHGKAIGQQRKALDPRAWLGEQSVERAIHITAKRQLFRVNFDGADLLLLHSVQRLVGHEAGLHGAVRTAARELAVYRVWATRNYFSGGCRFPFEAIRLRVSSVIVHPEESSP